MPAVAFDAKTHTYRVGGEVYPSVTQICRYLQYDKASRGNPFIRDAAGAKGKKVHLYTQYIDQGYQFEDPPEIAGYLKAYRTFLRERSPRWIAIEQRIANTELKVAGTLDRFGLMDGGYVIADIKTTGVLDEDYVSAQLHGYKTILTDEGCIETLIEDPSQKIQLFSIQLKPTGEYIPYKADAKGSSLFTHCWMIDQIRKDILGAKKWQNSYFSTTPTHTR